MERMTSFHPAIFQAALLEVAEATKAAAQAAQAIQNAPQQTVVASPSSSPSSSNAQNVEWSKLLNKPPLFDYKMDDPMHLTLEQLQQKHAIKVLTCLGHEVAAEVWP